MDFELGDSDRPRGHALLYFRDVSDPEKVMATYLVVPPIVLDLAKYVPPLLAAQLPMGASAAPNVYPLPPFPEQVESHAYLVALANARGDDLIDGGSLSATDLQRLVMAVSETGERYATLYQEALSRLSVTRGPRTESLETSEELDVDSILLDVMTPAEKVERLARALGTLRYALDGGDHALVGETLADMQNVGKRLDAKYRFDELLAAAQERGERGGALSSLFVERCYKLAAQDYAAVAEIERRIEQEQAG
jgi:hypothetical protein